jgi:hypothetical protein
VVVATIRHAGDACKVRCEGRTELIHGSAATYFGGWTIEQLDPAKAALAQDTSAGFNATGCGGGGSSDAPVPPHEAGDTVAQPMLPDSTRSKVTNVQRRPARPP